MNTTAKPRFVWDDTLLLEAQLSAEERLVRDAAFAYASDHLTPKISAENRFPDIAGLKGPFTGLNAARYGITGSISKSSTPTKARVTCTR